MRPAWVAVDRQAAVRAAARSWHRAGLIDGVTRRALDEAPNDGRRLGPVLRVVAFAMTTVACIAALALLLLILKPDDETVVAALVLAMGLALVGMTEALKGVARLVDAGAESASGLVSPFYLLVGATWLIGDGADLTFRQALTLGFAVGVIVFAMAAVRWGSTTSALASTVFLGLLVAQTPQPRLAWTVAAAFLVPIGVRLSASPILPPSHRRSAVGIVLCAVAGLYLAWHLGSWDAGLLEREVHVLRSTRAELPPLPRDVAVCATALIPCAAIVAGLAMRRRALWIVGLLLGVASLVTLRVYVELSPVWLVLIVAGSALIVVALALRRWLDAGGAAERAGFTARPLSDEGERLGLVEVAVTAALASAGSRSSADEAPPGFQPKGGRSGGAGASGDF